MSAGAAVGVGLGLGLGVAEGVGVALGAGEADALGEGDGDSSGVVVDSALSVASGVIVVSADAPGVSFGVLLAVLFLFTPIMPVNSDPAMINANKPANSFFILL